jgi:membrane-associated phospholipid phosphatase
MIAIWPGALFCAYLSVTALLLAFGAGPTPWVGLGIHLLALTIAAITTWTPLVRPWLQRWLPMLLILFLYAELPLLITAAGHASVFDATVVGWERALFGGQPAVAWASRWPSRALSELLHSAYLSYYLIIYSVPIALQIRRRDAHVARAIFVVLLTFVVCFLTYIAFPVAGPRYLWNSPAGDVGGVARTLAVWVLESQSSRGTAFPSSHVAVATTQAVLALWYFGARGAIVAVGAALLALGAVYGGFHYLIDVLVGLAVGVAVGGLGLAITARQAKATAPT